MELDALRRVERLLGPPNHPSASASLPRELRDIVNAAGGDEAVEAVAQFVPRLYDAGLPVGALRYLQQPTLTLYTWSAEMLALDTAWSLPIARFFDLLKRRVPRVRPGKLELKQYPYFFLHYDCLLRAARDPRRERIYAAVVPHAHRALCREQRRLGSQAQSGDLLYRFSCAARRFVRFVPPALIPGPDTAPLALPPEIIHEAFTAFARQRLGVDDDRWPSWLTQQERRCIRLLRGDEDEHEPPPAVPPRRRRRLTRRGRLLSAEHDDDREVLWTADVSTEATREGESPWDDSETVSMLPAGRIPWSGAHRRPRIVTLWDPGVLQPADLARLYAPLRLAAPEELAPEERTLVAASLLLFHFGQDLGGLLAALDIDPTRSAVTATYRLDDDVLAQEAPPPGLYLPGGRLVTLRLPPWLSRLVRASGMAGLATDRRLDRRDLEDRLRARSPRLTLATLRRSFFPYYESAGLDRPLAAFVANTFPPDIRSTCFYLNVAIEDLNRRFAQAYQRVQTLIASHCPGPVPAEWSTIDEAWELGTGRVGSWFVPDPAAVREFFQALERRLDELGSSRDLAGVIGSHNLYACYVLLAVAWGTAVRPRREPTVDCASLRGPSRWIVLSDKHNRRYREARPVPVPEPLWAMLSSLDRGSRMLSRRLGAGGELVGPAPTGFFVVVRKEAHALSAAHLHTLLAGEGLDYGWKLNAARHAWISHRVESSRPVVRIDPYVGHVHSHREPWGEYSLAWLARHGEEARAYGAEMLGMMGIAPRLHPLDPER